MVGGAFVRAHTTATYLATLRLECLSVDFFLSGGMPSSSGYYRLERLKVELVGDLVVENPEKAIPFPMIWAFGCVLLQKLGRVPKENECRSASLVPRCVLPT